MPKIVEKDLSYKIVGILFEVHTELGGQYQEKYYQRAVAKALQAENIPFVEQIAIDLTFKDEKIGKYYLDFLIDNKVILELKAEPQIRRKELRQVLAYLKASKVELGIVANFRGDKLRYVRVLNSEVNFIRNNSDTIRINSGEKDDKF